MEDALISNELFELAKEKGFTNTKTFLKEVTRYYVDSGGNTTSEHYEDIRWVTEEVRPTQSLLQKWLREKHHMMIFVRFYNDGDEIEDIRYSVDVSEPNTWDVMDIFVKSEFITYEKALEEGLTEAVKLINEQEHKV